MNKTLQDQYLNIKEGKGHKGVFLTEVKRNFPNIVPQSADFALASKILKDKNIISENIVGIQAINTIPAYTKQPFETAFDNFLKEAKKKEENTKAEEKKTSKSVEETQDKVYDNKDTKNIDNLIFDQVMTGYYAELKDPANTDKTMEELKEIVMKNLAKDPIFYTKDGQFGVKGLGYSTEHPGLGEPKEAKGKHKASGYGDLNENQTVDIDETRGGGNYGILTITPGKGGGGKRFIPDHVILSSRIRKQFGDHMVYNPSSETFYVSQILYNNLVKGYADQPAIKKLIMDLPPMVKQLLNKTENYGTPTQLPKQYKSYVPFIKPVGKAESDKFNKVGDKQYWAVGDFKFPNINKDKYSPELAEELYEEESKIRNIIRSLIKEELSKTPLNENLPKRLKEIENESIDEVKTSKLNKLKAEIEKRQSQLDMIEGNEDLKELTDKNKIKSLHKEIKLLEKAMVKLEKTIKGGKKEVIDEVGLEDLENIAYGDRDPKDGNLKKEGLEGGPDDPNNPYDKSENYDVAKRELEIWLDRIDDGTLDADIIEDKIDTYLSNTSGAWLEVPEDQIPMLKQDLITKYLGTDND